MFTPPPPDQQPDSHAVAGIPGSVSALGAQSPFACAQRPQRWRCGRWHPRYPRSDVRARHGARRTAGWAPHRDQRGARARPQFDPDLSCRRCSCRGKLRQAGRSSHWRRWRWHGGAFAASRRVRYAFCGGGGAGLCLYCPACVWPVLPACVSLSSPPTLSKSTFFCRYAAARAMPVSAKAQGRVAIPEGLRMKKWISKPAKQRAIAARSRILEQRAGTTTGRAMRFVGAPVPAPSSALHLAFAALVMIGSL